MEPATFFILVFAICSIAAAAFYYSRAQQLEQRLIDAETARISDKHEFLRLSAQSRNDLEKWQDKTLTKFGYSAIHQPEPKKDVPNQDLTLLPIEQARRNWEAEERLSPTAQQNLREKLKTIVETNN